MTRSPRATRWAGPVGDLRLMPDPWAVRILAAQPGWAWAPVDKHTQDGEVYAGCQRTFAKRQVIRAADEDLELRMAFEFEWFVGRTAFRGGPPGPPGPGLWARSLASVSDYAVDLIGALEDEGVGVDQFHPEYALGQLEISVPPTDPVGAADANVLVRQTIRGVAARHGLRASFSPVVIPGHVGNGGHLHFSVWRHGSNLLTGGDGPSRHDRDRGGVRRRCARRATGARRRRVAERAELPAPHPLTLGRTVCLLGPGEPRGRHPLHHRDGGHARDRRERGGEVLRPERQSLPRRRGGDRRRPGRDPGRIAPTGGGQRRPRRRGRRRTRAPRCPPPPSSRSAKRLSISRSRTSCAMPWDRCCSGRSLRCAAPRPRPSLPRIPDAVAAIHRWRY